MKYDLALITIYLCFALAFIVYSTAGIYHLWRFGYSGDLSKLAIIVYAVMSVAIISTTLILIIFNLP